MSFNEYLHPWQSTLEGVTPKNAGIYLDTPSELEDFAALVRQDLAASQRVQTPRLTQLHLQHVIWAYERHVAAQFDKPLMMRATFYAAVWAHDWGKISLENKGKNHKKISLKLVAKHAPSLLYGPQGEILEDCILNHGTKNSPRTFAGEAFRLADKLARIHPEYQDQMATTYGNYRLEDWFATGIEKTYQLWMRFPARASLKNLQLNNPELISDYIELCHSYFENTHRKKTITCKFSLNPAQ
jgi:hypothetical protein